MQEYKKKEREKDRAEPPAGKWLGTILRYMDAAQPVKTSREVLSSQLSFSLNTALIQP